jgi:osmoprotectant transport system ATP-binding protein
VARPTGPAHNEGSQLITLEHVSKVFTSHGRTVPAVDDVSFEVGVGELHVLIGPSGSGKTTTMRMINGLETPTAGRILIDGRDIQTMNEVDLRRGIGYVIQQGGLFPHFTVADNVAVVPRLLGWPRQKRRQRAEELLALVGLPPALFADRYPRELSGGQQQRVGVARALAADPPIVLMDEPFGAVDPITRKQLQRELRRIQAEVHKTIVFVTHDIAEAFLLGDRIVLMAEGRVVQNGTPADLLRNPSDPFVTSFIGEDRGLRSLQFTSLIDVAGPPPPDAPRDGMILPGALSILDAGREIALHGEAIGDGIWVGDDAGQRAGYLTYQQFAALLGETLAADEPETEADHNETVHALHL